MTEQRVEVGEFEVNPDHKTRANCPSCDKKSTLYHLGTPPREEWDDGPAPEVGWVCGWCESVVVEFAPSDGGHLEVFD